MKKVQKRDDGAAVVEKPASIVRQTLLSSEQVAALLGIKVQSLRLQRLRGNSPPYLRLSDSRTSRVFYPADDFDAWLAARPRFTSTAQERTRKGGRKTEAPEPAPTCLTR